MKRLLSLLGLTVVSLTAVQLDAADSLIDGKKTIVFLGDSNTFAGTFVAYVEAVIRQDHGKQDVEFLNLGLPSETVSGLSEPDHPFPRPNVHERLNRVLAKLKPDLVVAGYGINDGIYYPYSDERFNAYKNGIDLLIKKVKESGSEIVLLTPSPFDPGPQRKAEKLRTSNAESFAWFAVFEDYDDVMETYAKWILSQSTKVTATVDIRSPLVDYTNERRKDDANFALSGDGVHFEKEGHRLIATAILKSFGYEFREPSDELLTLVTKRQHLLRDAWLSETGHKRPGMKPGLPIDQARGQANDLDALIKQQLQ
jgi:lysophospholipase L1-like esterase